MRKTFPLVVVVAAVFALCPASAFALPRSGQVADEQDQLPSIQSRKLPDIKQVSASYDPDINQFSLSFDLYDALGYDGQYDSGSLQFGVGTSAGTDGNCITSAIKGDFFLSGYFAGYPGYSYASGSLSAAGYAGTVYASGAVSADRKTITYSLNGLTPLANRDYNCVGDIALIASGARDEARDFYFGSYKPPAPPDTTPPSAVFAHPMNGEQVAGIWTEGGGSGKHNCQVNASDNVGVDRAVFYLDGAFLNNQENPPWSCEWDTRTTPNGSHTLAVTVWDNAGNSTSRSITVVVDNAAALDKTPPSVSFLNPVDGQRISGIWNEGGAGGFNCQVAAADDVSVVGARFQVDGAFLNQQESPPWSCEWDTHSTPNGPHVLTAGVWDAAGNTSTRSITVIVDNPSEAPPTLPAPSPSPPVSPVVVAPPSTTPPADTSPAKISLVPRRVQRIAGVLSTGIVAPVRCSESCKISLTARISRGQARALHLRTSKTWLTIGSAKESVSGPGRVNALIEISPLVEDHLRHARRVKVVLNVTVTDMAGNKASAHRTITLKR